MTAYWRATRRLGSLGRMVRALVVVAMVLASLAPGRALAHPQIDEARAAYDATQHERGLELLEQAEAGTDLSRDELAELLLLRAMIHRALRQMDLAEIDLFRLAALDPARELGREVHPSLRRLFATVQQRVPGPVRLEAGAEREGETVEIRVAVTDDVAALAQGFRIHGRVSGGAWRESTTATLTLPADPSEGAEYWAEVIGPGGAVIATHASAASPATLAGAGGEVAVGDEVVREEPETGAPVTAPGEEVPAWPFIVGGVALALIVGAVILGVVLSQPTDDTQLTRPSVQSLVSAPAVLLTFD